MKKTIFLLPFLLLLAACSDNDMDTGAEPIPGTESPQTERADTYEVTYQYRDGVIVLTDSRQQYIERVENDSILYFRKDTPPDVLPAEGSVISGRASDKLPYGLGNVVLSCTEVDGLYRCVTSVAPLDEVFSELEIESSIPLLADIGDFTDDQGVYHEVTYVDADGNELSPQSRTKNQWMGATSALLSFDFGKLPPEGSTKPAVYARGTVAIGVTLNFNYNLSDKSHEMSLTPMVRFAGELGTVMRYSDTKKLFSKYFPMPGAIIIGPVVLRPYLGVKFEAKAQVEGSLKFGIEQTFACTTGFKKDNEHDGAFCENNTTFNGFDCMKSLELDAKGDVALVATLEALVGLYTSNVAMSLSPSMSFGGSADFQLKNENLFRNNSMLRLSWDLGADGIFRVHFFGHDYVHEQVSLFSRTLWSNEWPLFPVQESMDYMSRYSGGHKITYTFSDLGLLSHFMDIYHGIKLYYGLAPHWEPVRVVMDEKPLDAQSGVLTYTQRIRESESGGGYTACPILQVGEFYFEGDTCSYGTSMKW